MKKNITERWKKLLNFTLSNYRDMQFKEVIGHDDVKRKLIQAKKDGRVSHAQLILGPEGTHKLGLAIAYAQFLNCENPSENDSCGVCSSCIKYQKLSHPDLHFIFPTINAKSNDKPCSDDYMAEWMEYLKKTDCHVSLSDWIHHTWDENKQGVINVKDAHLMIEKINVKNYEAKIKVFIIWMVEKLQHQAAPKLLKTIEEPPENSLILMITENYDKVLSTILSRSQLIKLSKYPDEIVRNELIARYQVPVSKAANITRFVDGNFFHALKAAKEESEYDYTKEYADLMRNAFMVVHKKTGLDKLEAWVSSAAKQSRDNQIEFFKYCLNMTRQSMFTNFNEEKLINVSDEENDFLSKFSPFINEANAMSIAEEINRTIRHIERNGNPNIVLLDMAFNIGKLLRKM